MVDEKSIRFSVTAIAIVFVYGALLAACSQAPQEPAPVFALPASRVIGAPAIEGQNSLPSTATPARGLHYAAVPPGQKVAGMARAHLILDQAHHPKRKLTKRVKHLHATKAEVKTATRAPPANEETAPMIPLDEPQPKASAAKTVP